MPETISSSPTGGDQTKKDGTCPGEKAVKEKPWERQNGEDNATSQALVLFGPPKETVEIFHESKMTNTAGVNKGIYFSYPCRRHSCALVNIPAPCVNKMISHIEDVESKIQEHLKQIETSFEEWSSAASTKDLRQDWGIVTPAKEVKPEEERDEKCPELKQEMETLLSEAIHLIKSLETDRAEAEEALKRHRSRRKKINMKIDSWSIWKLQEIPLAVQKEHEAYLRDIIELRWHLEDKSQQLKQVEEQKGKWEEANAKLQADVDYMTEHAPLLDSKWIQELEALNEYKRKNIEVMGLYKQVHEELEETIESRKTAKLNAIQLREEMEKDIANTKISIEAYKKEINKLSHLGVHYSTSIHEIWSNIEENEEAVTEVLKETKTSTNELSSLSKKLDELKRVCDQLIWKKKNYENEYLEALNSFYTTQKTWDIELSNIAQDFSDISIVYAQLMEENKKLVIDIENISKGISESIRKKAQFESEIQSLIKLKSKNETFLKELYKDAYNIGTVFHLTKFKTEELEEKIAEVRRKFKGREDFLKKLTRGEVANGMMIQKKLYSIQEDQINEKQQLLKKKAVYALTLAELDKPMRQLEEDAEKLRIIHKEHFEALNDIIQRKEQIKAKVKRTKKNLRRKGKKTHDALVETEERISMIFREIETTKGKTSVYQAKISQLNKELKEKEKEKENFDQILDSLRDQLIAIRYKKEHAQAVFDHLASEKKDCEERLYEEEQRFRTLVTMRQKTLADIKRMQADSLEENLRLAQEYQKLQTTFLTEKDNYFNLYDRQLSLDAPIRDQNQLCQLQRRIHKVWQEHFKLVVLYSQRRLAKFQTDSQESIQEILAVQEESSNLKQHILDFFQSLTDSSRENDG